MLPLPFNRPLLHNDQALAGETTTLKRYGRNNTSTAIDSVSRRRPDDRPSGIPRLLARQPVLDEDAGDVAVDIQSVQSIG
jgi:hypothetical protein